MNVTIIANPNAGSGAGTSQLKELQEACYQQGIHVRVFQTTAGGQMPQLMEQILPTLTYDEKLVIIGGDGTLNEAIHALKAKDASIPVAYFPAGTGNDFARQLKMTNDACTFVEKLQHAPQQTVECIQYHEAYTNQGGIALNSLGFGLDAEICDLNTGELKSNKKRWGLSKLSYITPIIQAFLRHKRFNATIQLNDNTPAPFDQILLVGFFNHSYFGGGVRFVPQASQNSHTFEAVVVRDVSGWTITKAAPFIVQGTHFDHFPKNLIRKTVTTGEIHIQTPITMQTDGEVYHFEKAHIKAHLTAYPMWMTN